MTVGVVMIPWLAAGTLTGQTRGNERGKAPAGSWTAMQVIVIVIRCAYEKNGCGLQARLLSGGTGEWEAPERLLRGC